MGLLDQASDQLKNLWARVEPGTLPAMMSALLAKSDTGGLQGMVDKLKAAGLEDKVQSWLGSGSNLPINPEQLRAALGNEQVQQIARQLGLPVDEAMKLLADRLPTAVDQASPDGKLQEPAT
jgi:uncharacterized protein YidB (DUF937 family)